MSLITLNGSGDSLIEDIFNNQISIFEDIQGSKLLVRWDGNNFEFKTKSIKNDPVNLLDLSLQKFYNKAINYFYLMDERILSLMPNKWTFCFEYFADNQPAHINYTKSPKNSLILTGIIKSGKFDYTIEEIIEYAGLFGCDHLPIVFNGKLNDYQKEGIKYFLNTSKKDLTFIFGEENFAHFFYKLLDPTHENSFLMGENEFQPNVEKLIIRINYDTEYGYQILNPLYHRTDNSNNTEYTDVYSMILLNFLNYAQNIDVDKMKLNGIKRDEVYIDLICRLYNMYMNDVHEDIKELEFVIPKFFNKEKFKINTKLLSNKVTKNYINQSSKNEYIFKCILGSLNKHKKGVIGLFTEDTLKLFNNYIDKLNSIIDFHLNKIKEDDLRNDRLMNFQKFTDFSTDAEGETYPDVYQEFDLDDGESNMKKNVKKIK